MIVEYIYIYIYIVCIGVWGQQVGNKEFADALPLSRPPAHCWQFLAVRALGGWSGEIKYVVLMPPFRSEHC
jgi:hypothetical protein